MTSQNAPLKKDITFIYMDSAERHMYAPLVKEAQKRGYKTKLTNNKLENCEIGFYCQHVNYPQYSKFSLIMLHDIIQQYGAWPDLWYREPWDKYDIGILPSMQWAENWRQCSQWAYARPRNGMYLAGWPKADALVELTGEENKAQLVQSMDIDPEKRTVLYAPAWENDGKQIDFIEAMWDLGESVNILVKQWDADPKLYPSQVENVKLMAKLYDGVPGVTILPPETNIFTAIAVSDVLVSEESSTMCEAAMMGIPAVSVSDWLIPDTVPSRFPECSYTFVAKTTKADLAGCVGEILGNYDCVKAGVEEFAARNFSNIGNASSIIMDVVDDCVEGRPPRHQPIEPNQNARVPFRKEMRRKFWNLKREVYGNQRVRYPLVGAMWKLAASTKHAILCDGQMRQHS